MAFGTNSVTQLKASVASTVLAMNAARTSADDKALLCNFSINSSCGKLIICSRSAVIG